MDLYQNASKPRFWIPITPYLKQANILTIESDSIDGVKRLIDLDPYNPVKLPAGQHSIEFRFSDPSWIDESQKYFIGMIGQKFSTSFLPGMEIIHIYSSPGGFDGSQFTNPTGFVQYNHGNNAQGLQPEYDGIYLREFNLPHVVDSLIFLITTKETFLGSLFIGKVYDSSEIPQSPNSDINFTRSYNNSKTTTDRGLQYSNSHYMTNPMAKFYELTENNLNYRSTSNLIQGRSDLRGWDLSYSNINEQNLFSRSDSMDPVDTDGSSVTDYNFYKDNNVFDQMIHFTQGDALPFVFQPDEDNFMPDQFAVCRFGMPEFKMERDSFNTYKYSISILEEF